MKEIKNKLFNFRHARTPAQRAKMIELTKMGACPFCPKYLKQYHDNSIEKTGKYWVVTKNDYPYEGTTHHYLLIYRQHIEHIKDVSKAGFAELSDHIKWLTKKHNLPAGGLAVRFGDSDYTGASISHLHAQLLIGHKVNSKNKKKILNFPIGYKK
jgi:ATP adenylyltransferase